MSEILTTKIASVRRKQTLISAGSGLAAILGLAILLLAATMILDFYLELPHWLRAAFLALDMSVLAYVIIIKVLTPTFFGPNDEQIALQVEHALPDFRTRLIASIQLSNPQAVPAGTSKSLVQAMIRQTEQVASPIDFAAIIPHDPLVKTSALSAFILILGLSAFVYSAHLSTDLLKRAFLADLPVPRQTRVNCLTQNKIIAIGDPITIEAIAAGVIPNTGRVRIDYNSGRNQILTINPKSDDPRHFQQLIDNVQESFSYSIRLNDCRTQTYNVQAVARPTIASIDMQQTYPPYTRRAPERRSPGDLLLLAGSQLKVQVKSNKPIRNGYLHLVGPNQDLPLPPSSNDHLTLTGVINPIPPTGLTGFSVRLIDDLGISSNDQTVYPIDVLIDKDPTVRIIWPDRKEELATQQARLLMSFEAADDYGVARVLLHYRVDKQVTPETMSPGEEKFIELDLSKDKPEDLRRLKRRYEFNLGSLKPIPLEGSAVEYWLEVQDGNNVTGPGRAFSDRFRARIVSEIAKRADLMNRLNDQLGTIESVTTDEEKLNQNLGALILEKPQ